MYQVLENHPHSVKFIFNGTIRVTYEKHMCVGGPSNRQWKTRPEVEDTAYVLCSIPKWRRDLGDHKQVWVWMPN